LIAGHPGESEFDFEEMKGFVEKSRFERLGVFTYSHEEGTHSFSMQDDVPAAVKQVRADAIMDLQEKISFELNQAKVGKEFKVLIDRIEGANYVGRTEYDSPEVDNEVIISSENNYLRIGDFSMIKITRAEEFDLFGIPVQPA
jgi:ribosomal protein S12 methylthiotransferase